MEYTFTHRANARKHFIEHVNFHSSSIWWCHWDIFFAKFLLPNGVICAFWSYAFSLHFGRLLYGHASPWAESEKRLRWPIYILSANTMQYNTSARVKATKKKKKRKRKKCQNVARIHRLTCFKIPTNNSSTLCWIPLDVSMNLASMDLAKAFPSDVGITRERAKSALLPTNMTALSFVTFSRHKYFTISSAWRNDARCTTE